MRRWIVLATLLTSAAFAQDDAAEDQESAAAAGTESTESVKQMSGMSILGNEEAPKALVIVPWKSSRLGDGLGISDSMDESPRPVDKEVFMRELHFYEMRSGSVD